MNTSTTSWTSDRAEFVLWFVPDDRRMRTNVWKGSVEQEGRAGWGCEV